jgi:hypothetical protein
MVWISGQAMVWQSGEEGDGEAHALRRATVPLLARCAASPAVPTACAARASASAHAASATSARCCATRPSSAAATALACAMRSRGEGEGGRTGHAVRVGAASHFGVDGPRLQHVYLLDQQPQLRLEAHLPYVAGEGGEGADESQPTMRCDAMRMRCGCDADAMRMRCGCDADADAMAEATSESDRRQGWIDASSSTLSSCRLRTARSVAALFAGWRGCGGVALSCC